MTIPAEISVAVVGGLFTLIGIVIGAILTQIVELQRDAISGRRAMGSAISDLLEIRHRLRARIVLVEEIAKRVPLTGEQIAAVVAALEQFFPHLIVDETLAKRYDGLVSAISERDPVLGFRLRSKENVLPWVSMLSRISAQDPTAAKAWAANERELLEGLASGLLEAILLLGEKRGGLRERRRLEEVATNAAAVPSEFASLVDRFFASQAG